MKKFLKILEIIIISLIGLFTIFIFEESIRLEHYPNSKPLIIIDKIMCSKDDWICYGDDKKYTEEYYSIGFSLKMNYYLDKNSSEDNHIYQLTGKEFMLFNKFRLWTWVS